MKIRFSLSAVIFNVLIGALIGLAISDGNIAAAQVGAMLNLAIGLLRIRPEKSNMSILQAGVNKEIWIGQIMENFYPAADFLSDVRDMTEFVEYNTINLAEVGADPAVLENNNTYPIAILPRPDSPIAIPLDTLDTVNTVVRNLEKKESAYNKVESVNRGHKNQLLLRSKLKASHAYAPMSDTGDTPIFETTGAAAVIGVARKRMTWDDLFNMSTAYDMMEIPDDGRRGLIHPMHIQDLYQDPNIDGALKAQIFNLKTFGFGEAAGFKLYKWTRPAIYVKATKAKKPFGAAITGADSSINSTFYYNQEVMKADGSVEMFLRENDPEHRGDIVGYQKRFIALPIREKALGAIISGTPTP